MQIFSILRESMHCAWGHFATAGGLRILVLTARDVYATTHTHTHALTCSPPTLSALPTLKKEKEIVGIPSYFSFGSRFGRRRRGWPRRGRTRGSFPWIFLVFGYTNILWVCVKLNNQTQKRYNTITLSFSSVNSFERRAKQTKDDKWSLRC